MEMELGGPVVALRVGPANQPCLHPWASRRVSLLGLFVDIADLGAVERAVQQTEAALGRFHRWHSIATTVRKRVVLSEELGGHLRLLTSRGVSMRDAIISKLNKHFSSPPTGEADVVYSFVQIRKLLERGAERNKYAA